MEAKGHVTSPRLSALKAHCEKHLKSPVKVLHFGKGPIDKMPEGFCVLEFEPSEKRNVWVYATCGMSCGDAIPIEIFMFSPRQASEHLELLYAIAHSHVTAEALDFSHTVNFGRPWLPESKCEYGLLSAIGSDIDTLEIDADEVQFLWLIPITEAEREYKKKHGFEALEEKFARADMACEDPQRKSVV
ncbi:MAG: suppressor of fused domain protein [Candidatus Obscuribacterales bacterium]|nr:suppressor of fused domain protein [Candidatus Obscuribacterales bacterium]